MRQEHETATSFKQLQEITQAIMLKKGAQAKKERLNPIKKAFSERQKTTIRDNTQASANKRLKNEQANNSNLREKPSNKAFKPGLATHQEKGGSDE
ncbi:hypothetical protein KVM47_04580 [Helicobacter pylori]|nr:hypothetical protein KVM47_04580 [Helicobacter pylori]